VTSRRPGYTLFELILTTAVIAITAAVTVPSIDSMYPSYKLNASVDAVRAAWALGRAHAIEEGRPYRFAVAPGGGKYRLSPDDSTADGPQPSDADPNSHSLTLDDQLPQGVTFATGDDDGQAAQGPQSADGLSTVAVFLPDGTARDDAEVRFQVKGALPKSVKLRGLTGAVTVQQQSPDGGGKR
jgi:prepilin-type N-terminal cleavage/methylation domain-containing protein